MREPVSGEMNIMTNVKNSVELLRSYSDLIMEAENDVEPSTEPAAQDQQFDFSQPASTDDDPVGQLAEYLEEANEEDDFTQLIQQFLKDKNYEIVPTRGLENPIGNV